MEYRSDYVILKLLREQVSAVHIVFHLDWLILSGEKLVNTVRDVAVSCMSKIGSFTLPN
jgi:hypothetical protein